MSAVVFDPLEFKVFYPQFEAVADERLTMFFTQACILLDNTDKSVVENLDERKILLYLLTCHIATLAERGGDIVGALTSAGEGSVNVAYSAPSAKNGAWYMQTQCGATYWQMTLPYRVGGLYIAGDC